MSGRLAVSEGSEAGFVPLEEQRRWLSGLNWTAALLISAVFLLAGLWKITDPIGAAARLSQAKVPQSLSLPAAILLGVAETFTGVLLLVPRFRRLGSALGTLLLTVFMLYIGLHYTELRGADCSCFPWIKRAVGPGFFFGDGTMILLALIAGLGSVKFSGVRPAVIILSAVAVFASLSFGFEATRHTGVKAPASILSENGQPISLTEGKVFIYFFNPQCVHCLEAGRKLAALHWGETKFVGVPTENPQFGDWFMGKAGLSARGPVSKDLALLRRIFPFDLPPAGLALENGYEKARLLQFEDSEPAATLIRIGFAH